MHELRSLWRKYPIQFVLLVLLVPVGIIIRLYLASISAVSDMHFILRVFLSSAVMIATVVPLGWWLRRRVMQIRSRG